MTSSSSKSSSSVEQVIWFVSTRSQVRVDSLLVKPMPNPRQINPKPMSAVHPVRDVGGEEFEVEIGLKVFTFLIL